MSDLRNLLKISDDHMGEVNALLTDPSNELINELLEVIEGFGGPQEINRKSQEASTGWQIKKPTPPLFPCQTIIIVCWEIKPNRQRLINKTP
jgi:hypothetical protein